MVMKQNNNDTTDYIELKVLQSIYDVTQDEEGNDKYKLIKKDIVSKQLVFKEDIKSIKQELTKYGKVYKTKCTVLVNGNEPLLIKGNYDNLKKEIFNNSIKRNIGFKFY